MAARIGRTLRSKEMGESALAARLAEKNVTRIKRIPSNIIVGAMIGFGYWRSRIFFEEFFSKKKLAEFAGWGENVGNGYKTVEE